MPLGVCVFLYSPILCTLSSFFWRFSSTVQFPYVLPLNATLPNWSNLM
jgi:hypothetical protein